MKLRSSIFWVILLQCALFAASDSECPQFSDPNTYIDDPNTLDNGLFECGDPNLTEYNFNAPFVWDRIVRPGGGILQNLEPNDCYAGLHSYFDPPPLSNVEWTIDNPYQGDSFLLLHTGHPDPNNSITGYNETASRDVRGAIVSQQVLLNEGDTILGAYFFGTSDYLTYNDCGSIYLQPDPGNDPNDPVVIIAVCDVNTVGNYRSTLGLSPETDGWISFSYTVDSNQIGFYDLRCEVEDDDDTIYDSYFAIDGLRICRGGQPDADLDWDCDVDLVDYSILSKAWLSFCPDSSFNDPNYYDPNNFPPVADPNFVNYDADLDDDWYVDVNDLIIMFDPNEWLYGLLSE